MPDLPASKIMSLPSLSTAQNRAVWPAILRKAFEVQHSAIMFSKEQSPGKRGGGGGGEWESFAL